MIKTKHTDVEEDGGEGARDRLIGREIDDRDRACISMPAIPMYVVEADLLTDSAGSNVGQDPPSRRQAVRTEAATPPLHDVEQGHRHRPTDKHSVEHRHPYRLGQLGRWDLRTVYCGI